MEDTMRANDSYNLNELDVDDAPIGRVLNRREALRILGGAGASAAFFLAACRASTPTDAPSSTATCTARPALTEGPYFVDERLNRADVRADTATGVVKAGALLALAFNVTRIQSSTCTPLANAMVDIWHTDALGVYSDAVDASFNTRGQNFLRGYQLTDANGTATFTTIVPGWYNGRATHIHFKIRGTTGSSFDFTSQLFFTEGFLSQLYTSAAPYTTKGDSGRLRNSSDGIYNSGGSQLLVTPAASGSGYTTTLNIGLNV
jgi:protocatechuate 3,4-dioxygenase beta subunit